MIQNKKDFKYYVSEDRKHYPHRSLFERLFYPSEHDIILRQIYNLRLLEYRLNTKKNIIDKLLYFIQRCKYTRILNRTQMRLYPNVFGPGLYIPHIGRISVSPLARIGANCTIRPNSLIASNLGVNRKKIREVTIGDNVEISEGCKIFCKKVGDNVKIGPNAVVFKNVPNNVSVISSPCIYITNDV